MIASEVRYIHRRLPSIAFHISDHGKSILHTLVSGAASLAFFGVLVCLMGLFQ